MKNKNLQELINEVLNEMHTTGFAAGTIRIYTGVFKRLQKLADARGDTQYSFCLGKAFISDSSYERSEKYCHSRYCYHCRCVQFIESYIADGQVDWTPNLTKGDFSLYSDLLQQEFKKYDNFMLARHLKRNTIDGYRRFVFYFLQYLEMKGYDTLDDLKSGDILAFITLICAERYQPTSLGAHVPGLRLFLSMNESTSTFSVELPLHLPKKRAILEVYSDAEYSQVMTYLNENEKISLRNKALCIIALKTGLRAVDICNLKLSDIDWGHDHIHIIQEKTGKAHNIPLTNEIGNALSEYLLDERPVSDSMYVFLRSTAPFQPLLTHTGCRQILLDIISDAGVKGNGRPYGTRITRHSTASRLLRHGVPLSVISEALGHGNPNSVMIYLSTDEAKLVECTLPLPGKRVI